MRGGRDICCCAIIGVQGTRVALDRRVGVDLVAVTAAVEIKRFSLRIIIRDTTNTCWMYMGVSEEISSYNISFRCWRAINCRRSIAIGDKRFTRQSQGRTVVSL